MLHSHAPVQVLPQLKRLDRHFGGPWSKLDINDRARDWAKHLAAAPIASIETAVDYLIEHHEGHYPKLAYVRRVALEHAQRRAPKAEATPESERCGSCGEMPGWHRIDRPHAAAEVERRQTVGLEVDYTADPHLRPTIERLVTRHLVGYPCQRFNAAHRFADGTEPAETPTTGPQLVREDT